MLTLVGHSTLSVKGWQVWGKAMGSAEDTGEGDGARDSTGGGTKVKKSLWPMAMCGVNQLPVALHIPGSVGLFFDGTSSGHPEALLMHLPASRSSHGEH